MDNQTKIGKLPVTGILSLWFIWLLSLIGQSLFADIPEHFYEWLGTLLGYKILSKVCIFLLVSTLSLLILYLSRHVNKDRSIVDMAITPDHNLSKEIPSVHQKGESKRYNLQDSQIRFLNYLTKRQKEILRRFIVGGMKYLEIENYLIKDTDFEELVKNKIISISDKRTMLLRTKTVVIDECAWEYLKDNPKLLE